MIWGSISDDPVAGSDNLRPFQAGSNTAGKPGDKLRALVTQTGFIAYKPDNSGANDAVPVKV